MKPIKIKVPVLKLNLYKVLTDAVEEALAFRWESDDDVRQMEKTATSHPGEDSSVEGWDEAYKQWVEESEALDAAVGETTADAVIDRIAEITNLRDMALGVQKRVRNELISQCRYGWMRAHKYVESPSVEVVRNTMENNICLHDIFVEDGE